MIGLLRLGLAAVAPVLLGALPAAAFQLLSIRGVELKDNEYIAAFRIESWGVRVRAVCHLPVGWAITVDAAIDPSSTLSGNASAGVAFLDRTDLGELDRLFLIDDPDKDFPQHFTGTISIGTYGAHELDWREHPLLPSSYVREAAERCPAP